jgi:hypothetical protein
MCRGSLSRGMGGGSLRLRECCSHFTEHFCEVFVMKMLIIVVHRLPADTEHAIAAVEAFIWAPRSE